MGRRTDRPWSGGRPRLAAPENPARDVTERPDAAPYAVGYGKPPIASRFQPGRSGNPKGRPKGVRNKGPSLQEERLKEIFLAEAYRTIRIHEGSRQVSVTMAQAIVRAMAVNAVKGQHRAQRLFAEMLSRIEAENMALGVRMLEAAVEYKERWVNTIDDARARGLPEPDPLPHPDHVQIDPRTGAVTFSGPVTRDQRDAGRELIARLDDSMAELAILEAERDRADTEQARALFEEDIAHEIPIRDLLLDYVMKVEWIRKEWIEKSRRR